MPAPMMRSLRLTPVVLLVLFLSGCGVHYYESEDYSHFNPRGIYHHVAKGQTLYSIAKAYGVSVDQLQRDNGIHVPGEMEVGMHLWIAGAQRRVYVAPTVDAPRKKAGETRRAPPTGRDSTVHKKSSSKKRIASKQGKKKTARKRKTLLWPVKGGVLTSRFGTRNGKNHHGLDIGAPKGTPIRAAAGGTVEFSGWGPRGYGLMIIIKHPGKLTTVYAHNSKNLVKKGKQVKRGQKIAKVGKTGRATGTHVHFEVRNDTHPQNPLLFFIAK